MYFNLFMITLFLIYYFSHYSFYLSIVKFKQFKQQYPKYNDRLNGFRIFLIIMIMLIDSLVFILFIAYLNYFYEPYFDISTSIDIYDWGHSNFYFTLFFILGLINIFWVLLYYASHTYDQNGIIKKWHHKDVRNYIFDFPRIKCIHKTLGLILLGYFLLSFVQYHFYLNKISPYIAVDKYRHFLPTNYDRLAQEGTSRLNAHYQGRYYDDVFNEISQDWSSILIEQGEDIHTIQGMSLCNIKYQIVIHDLGGLLTPNMWGGYSHCVVYLNFLEDGIFSEAETYCSEKATFTITP